MGGARGDAETPDEPNPGSDGRTSDSASSRAGTVHPGKPLRPPSPASPATEDHPTQVGVNPDASLYCGEPGNDALGRHGQAGPDGWFGNVVPPGSACAAALAGRSRPRNRFDRDHSNRRSKPERDNPRKETASLARRNVRARYRPVDERHDCQDNVPACVPGTVWSTASRRNRQVALGAVLALKSAHANKPNPPRQPKLALQSQRARPRAAFNDPNFVKSALAVSPEIGGVHDDNSRNAPNKRGCRQPLTLNGHFVNSGREGHARIRV